MNGILGIGIGSITRTRYSRQRPGSATSASRIADTWSCGREAVPCGTPRPSRGYPEGLPEGTLYPFRAFRLPSGQVLQLLGQGLRAGPQSRWRRPTPKLPHERTVAESMLTIAISRACSQTSLSAPNQSYLAAAAGCALRRRGTWATRCAHRMCRDASQLNSSSPIESRSRRGVGGRRRETPQWDSRRGEQQNCHRNLRIMNVSVSEDRGRLSWGLGAPRGLCDAVARGV